ncbi:MAG: hypothetical protein IBX72_09735 [Nitrospirae bacterium]|nr:hypothetical protein [Nitrospirota bacterium]
MMYLILQVELLENAIFSRNLSPGNIYYSHNYIPGSVIWGYFAGKVVRKDKALFKNYFFSDRLIFSNLYPVKTSGSLQFLSLPLPFSTYACKYRPGLSEPPVDVERHGFRDYLIDESGLDNRCSNINCNAKLKEFSGGFYYKKGHNYYSFFPSMIVDMHNRIDEKSQTTPEDALYAYEVLSKGQSFKGYILFSKDEFKRLAALCEFKNSEVAIGKGRNNGYGLVRLSFLGSGILGQGERVIDKLKTQAQDNICKDITFDNSMTLTITCLSDTILMDECGNFITSIDVSVLASLLNQSQGGYFKANNFELIRRFSGPVEIDGYNAKHNLPKNKVIAIRKGSVFYFEYKGNDKAGLKEKLLGLELSGIGERKNEGFGSIAVNLSYHYENHL